MDGSLLGLMEDLVEAFERRETVEPGDRVGRVTARIRHLELQIAERIEQDRRAGHIVPAEIGSLAGDQVELDAVGSVA